MKRLLLCCFLVGGLAGWWGPRFAARENAGQAGRTGAHLEDGVLAGAGASGAARIRVQGERVEIPRDQLLGMLRRGPSPALRIESFWLPDQKSRWVLWSLAQLADLDEVETTRLDGILRETAAARKAWERARVRVELAAPGHWRLAFPGDQGQARAELKRRLDNDFGPAKAGAIDLGGDLANFFGFHEAPEFKHGLVEVRVDKINLNGELDPEAPGLLFQISQGGETYERRGSLHHLASDAGAMRIAAPLGGLDGVLAGMAE